MFLKDPITGQPSLPFMMYVLECEGEFDKNKDKEEEENEDDEPMCPRPIK